jgi:hypothetical protein
MQWGKERDLSAMGLDPLKNPEKGFNWHLSVKPLALMKHFATLITPPDSFIIDPFCGTGSTCIGAAMVGLHADGVDIDQGYIDIANARWAYHSRKLAQPLKAVPCFYKGDSAWFFDLVHTPDNFYSAIITDPPAGISLKDNEWDDDKGGKEQWITWLAAIMKVVLLKTRPGAFALVWAYPRTCHWTMEALERAGFTIRDTVDHIFNDGYPKGLRMEEGAMKDWNTTIRPAKDMWILAQKPYEGTVAENVKKWGTGLLNIPACMVRRLEPQIQARQLDEVW